MIICKNCGKMLTEDSLFCTGCGQKITSADTAEQVPAPNTESSSDTAAETELTANPFSETTEQEIADTNNTETASEFPAAEDITKSAAYEPSDFFNEPQPEEQHSNNNDLSSSFAPQNDMQSTSEQEPTASPLYEPAPSEYAEPVINDNTETQPLQNFSNNVSQPYTDNSVNYEALNDVQQNAANGDVAYYSANADDFRRNDNIMQGNPQPAANAAKKTVKVGAGRLFGASVLAFLAIIVTIVLSLLLCIKFGANGSSMRKRIEKLDYDTVFSANFDGDEISDDIYNTVGFGTATNGKADKDDFREFLKDAGLFSYIGEQVENYADYIIDGKGSDPSITSEDIVNDFFRENRNVAKESFGAQISEKGLDFMEKNLKDEDLDDYLSVREWSKKAGFSIKSVSYAFSYITIGITAALIIVFLILIAVIVDKRGKHLTGFYGNIFFISGLVIFVTGLLTSLGSSAAYAFSTSIALPCYFLANILLPFSLIAIGTGFAEMLIGFIFKMVKKGIKRKEAKALKA